MPLRAALPSYPSSAMHVFGCYRSLRATLVRPCAVLVIVLLGLYAVVPADAAESAAERESRMAWFREAKFGLFIHWGVYAVPAGSYQGKPVIASNKLGEWIMRNAEIPAATYRQYAREFNPVHYDPEAWMQLAVDAGMRYVVITAKHHDGFALYPSNVTTWDVADATPWGKDLLGPLADAARRRGLRFGLYYSQAQDWMHPGGAKARLAEGESWDESTKGNFDAYLRDIAAPQVREILTRYKPDILWWDTPTWMNPDRAAPLAVLRDLRPGLITNDRLGGGVAGDTETPEQYIPATGYKDRDWESCMTMNGTWGYKSFDTDWKSTATLLRNLVDIVSKGGNYLLNVGPTSEGIIPDESIQRLREIGTWMKSNSAAIYGTTASPFHKLRWGRATKKLTKTGGTLYLHVFDWPQDGRLVLPGLKNQVTAARTLVDGTPIATRIDQYGSVVLELPKSAPDMAVSVLEVDFTGELVVERRLPASGADGSIRLAAADADIHNTHRAQARIAGSGSGARVVDWNHHEPRVSWDLRMKRPGSYTVRAELTGTSAGRIKVQVGEATAIAAVAVAESVASRQVDLAVIEVKSAGEITLELTPEAADWRGFELVGITLIPKP